MSSTHYSIEEVKKASKINDIIDNIEKLLDKTWNEIKKLPKKHKLNYTLFDQVDSGQIASGKEHVKKARVNFRGLAV